MFHQRVRGRDDDRIHSSAVRIHSTRVAFWKPHSYHIYYRCRNPFQSMSWDFPCFAGQIFRFSSHLSPSLWQQFFTNCVRWNPIYFHLPPFNAPKLNLGKLRTTFHIRKVGNFLEDSSNDNRHHPCPADILVVVTPSVGCLVVCWSPAQQFVLVEVVNPFKPLKQVQFEPKRSKTIQDIRRISMARPIFPN